MLKYSKYVLVTGVVLVALGLVVCARAAHAFRLVKGLLGVRDLHAGHLLQTQLDFSPQIDYCRILPMR